VNGIHEICEGCCATRSRPDNVTCQYFERMQCGLERPLLAVIVDREKLVKLKAQGRSIKSIANECGIARSTVRRHSVAGGEKWYRRARSIRLISADNVQHLRGGELQLLFATLHRPSSRTPARSDCPVWPSSTGTRIYCPAYEKPGSGAIMFCPQYNPEYRAGFVRCNVLFTLLALSVLHLMAARAVAQVTTETATREARPQSRREPSCPKRGTWGGQSTHYGKTGRCYR